MRTGTLWRHRNFVLLWSGQSVSEVGSSVTVLALPLTAVVVLRATTLQVGLLTSASTAAFALIALPAGALVDRWAKRRLMIWCDVARLVIIGSVPLAAVLGLLTLGQLYAVAVTAGVATVFFDVAYQSYLPVVVDRDHLVEGNGKLGATQAFAQVTGPGLGGALAGLIGAARALAVDALSYAVSVASLLAINVPEDFPPKGGRGGLGGTVSPQELGGSGGDRPPGSLRKEIAEGLSFVLRHPVLRKIVACTGTANLFGAMGTALEIVFLIRVLRIRPADTGLLIAVASLGGVAGGLLAGRLGRRIGTARIIWFSLIVLGFPQLLIPLAAPGWRVAAFPVGMAFYSFGGVVYNVAQVSYRQSICPPRLLGRMNAAVRWVVWGTIPLGGVIGGVLGTLAGVRVTLWIAFSGSWAAGWWVFFSPLRRQRDLATQQQPEEDLEDHRAPGSGIGGQGGRERPDGAGPQLGD
ncbi:MAG TPA: MFS transporter [Streptosporangiaceae bacterium]